MIRDIGDVIEDIMVGLIIGTIVVVGELINVGKIMMELIIIVGIKVDLIIIIVMIIVLLYIDIVMVTVHLVMVKIMIIVRAVIVHTINGHTLIDAKIGVQIKERVKDLVKVNIQTLLQHALIVIQCVVGVQVQQLQIVILVLLVIIYLMMIVDVLVLIHIQFKAHHIHLNILVILEDVFRVAQQNIILRLLNLQQLIQDIHHGLELHLQQVKQVVLILIED